MFPFLLLLLVFASCDQVQSTIYQIEFDSVYAPPANIPKNSKDMVYSAPLNQVISKPIIARVKDSSGEIITPKGNPDVIISSVDSFTLNNPKANDFWQKTGGKLCQHTNFGVAWPQRLDRTQYSKRCSSEFGLTTKFVKELILLDWLSHEHPNEVIPSNLRFFRITIPDMHLMATSNSVNVTVPAASLFISKQPPKTVIANNPFYVACEIRDSSGKVVSEGLDSVPYVELTVSYEYKQFYNNLGKEMLIAKTYVRLGGSVETHQGTNDLVFRKQASNGRVNFTNVRILDVINDIRLNVTMYMSKDPWLRVPNCPSCYADIFEKDVTGNIVKFKPMTPDILKKTPSVSLTRKFDITSQTLDSFVITPSVSQTKPLKITRNFKLPGPMVLKARDANGNRIFSGPHANIPLTIETDPPGVCVSIDHVTYMLHGFVTLSGSICQIIPSVHLVYYSMVRPRVRVNSTKFNVVGEVHLAHFGDFRFSGMGRNIQPQINTFVKLAAHEINSDLIPGVLKQFQMKIIVHTVETGNDARRTNKKYTHFRRKAHEDPSRTLRGIILPTSRTVAFNLVRDANNDKIAMISIAQKNEFYSTYRFFNRICWGWHEIILSFLIAVHDRGWTRIAILRMQNEMMPNALHGLSSNLNISFGEDVDIPLFNPAEPDKEMLIKKMNDVRGVNTRIIIALINGSFMAPVLRSAYEQRLSAKHGFQWIFISEYARAFPINGVCGEKISCATAFKGSLLITEFYNHSNFNSDHWHRVLDSFYAVDRTIFMGRSAFYPGSDVGGLLALGYDAVWLFAESLNHIMSQQRTATGSLIIQELRNLDIDGLSGKLKMNVHGNRFDYTAIMKVVNPEYEDKIQSIRYIKLMEHRQQVELKFGTDTKNCESFAGQVVMRIPLPVSQAYNLRSFDSYTGGIDKEDYMLVRDETEVWPSAFVQRYEKIVPQYLCEGSCGVRISKEDVNSYDKGKCISMNVCKCHFGYYGHRCEDVMCDCLYGTCSRPFNCECDYGWTSKTCDTPICTFTCSHGKCVEPDKCKCWSSVWVDRGCSVHIASLVVPIIFILVGLIYLAYIGSFRLKKYLERKHALSNLGWLVTWSDVIIETAGTASNVAVSVDFCVWNKEKWYAKYFNSKTIDISDPGVRADMVELVTLDHKNLITYGGACLTFPTVCLLQEPALKGSLEDILINNTINLDWDFRFSFMRDICCGMNFLHTKTDLHSHGRLKSSNCLLDNRWTIRLSGFGAPTIRYGPYLMMFDEDDPNVYHENQMALLWTAPELLKTASSLNDVGMGTKEGDVYSFAIIVSEIVTRAVPFAHERKSLSIFSILDLLIDRDNANLAIEREIWDSVNGDLSCIRPKVPTEGMPGGIPAQNKFKKMLDDIWCEGPEARLPFQKLESILNNIYPSKGELADNLIHLLESYSKNLEQIVVERTNDMEIEKAKIDNIVGQMLPKHVVESLKHGKKVPPETFENISAFYSDIVGFTTIAKKSEPMQVVDLLNTLYGKFDAILAQYDVYKVETIGDAYVVSSGVPNRNGNLHAGEIATASIDIVCTIMTVPIPHLPEDKLLLRIGIHSGSVGAGVVGLKMPRFALFGDTMQITATMESSSKPLRVQISKDTVDILDQLGGFFYKLRGDRVVCGRTITTYWLIGKAGYEKALPTVDDDDD